MLGYWFRQFEQQTVSFNGGFVLVFFIFEEAYTFQ